MIPFVKMHGLGNDFVIVDDRDGALALDLDERRLLADRRRGIGCDQLLVLERPTNGAADVFMRIYNPDGSESGACGNGTRCVADLVMEETAGDAIGIETIAGILHSKRGAGVVSVDMGEPRFGWQEIPAGAGDGHGPARSFVGARSANPSRSIWGTRIAYSWSTMRMPCPWPRPGRRWRPIRCFPSAPTLSSSRRNDDGSLRMRVWERGTGITQACGSGACATIVAATKRGLVDGKARLHLDGGPLDMEWRPDGRVIMTGPTALSFRGEWPR